MDKLGRALQEHAEAITLHLDNKFRVMVITFLTNTGANYYT